MLYVVGCLWYLFHFSSVRSLWMVQCVQLLPFCYLICFSAKSFVHLRGHHLELLSNSQKTFRYNAVYILPKRNVICPFNTVTDVRNLILTQLWRILKSETLTYFKCVQKFSFRQWNYNKTKVAEEYCWVITQTVGRLCCGRSGSGVLESEFQLYSLVCTYI